MCYKPLSIIKACQPTRTVESIFLFKRQFANWLFLLTFVKRDTRRPLKKTSSQPFFREQFVLRCILCDERCTVVVLHHCTVSSGLFIRCISKRSEERLRFDQTNKSKRIDIKTELTWQDHRPWRSMMFTPAPRIIIGRMRQMKMKLVGTEYSSSVHSS